MANYERCIACGRYGAAAIIPGAAAIIPGCIITDDTVGNLYSATDARIYAAASTRKTGSVKIRCSRTVANCAARQGQPTATKQYRTAIRPVAAAVRERKIACIDVGLATNDVQDPVAQ